MKGKDALIIFSMFILILILILGTVMYLSLGEFEEKGLPAVNHKSNVEGTIPPLTLSPPENQPTPTETPPAPTEPSDQVDMFISMQGVSYELCCGIIPTKVKIVGTPIIENRGGATAHNIKVTFELFSASGTKIKLSGGQSIEREVGDLKGGGRVIEDVEFTITLVDAYRLQDSGAVVVFNIYSDEKSSRIEERFAVPQIG